jgi:NADPH:quinone reductase-like Zn-dependent oxidoreductase
VGTFTVQLAKAYGAEVTAVCGTRNVETVGSLGADHVVDYTRDDFTRLGQRYDLLVNVNGPQSIAEMRRVLTPKGTPCEARPDNRPKPAGTLFG